mmetsp:Transcript_23812/g.35175  ORF Transcript_23812/g.35175 Transcript_23812/m.35175 type:complete len:277 (+) Transcript_23812:236-1066(+)
MDDDDELLPNEDGYLDLKYRGWTEIDDAIWSLSERLVTIDISFNGITTVPETLGSLTQLKELNCSCNNITSLPRSIGRLWNLKILKANGNQLSKIPEEIGECKYLTHLLLSENHLTDLPQTIAECFRLKVLKLQSNNLRELPISMAKMDKIEIIDLSNNSDLEMVPTEMQENTEAILWILSVRLETAKEMEFILAATRDLALFAKSVIEKTADTQNKISLLREQKSCLLFERSSIKNYLTFEKIIDCCNNKIQNAAKECKKLFNRKSASVFATTDI